MAATFAAALLLAVVLFGRRIYMTRSQPNMVYTSAEQNAVANQGYFNDVGWTWGAARPRSVIASAAAAIGLWKALTGAFAKDTDGGPGIPGPYVSPMTFGLTDILGTTGGGGTGGDQTANNFTDNSPDHFIWRK